MLPLARRSALIAAFATFSLTAAPTRGFGISLSSTSLRGLWGIPYTKPTKDEKAMDGPSQQVETVAVTGTTGWLGGKLAESFVESGLKVTGMARRETEIDGVKAEHIDLMDGSSLDHLRNTKYDCVVHMAGALGWCTLAQAMELNFGGTRRLLDAAIEGGCKKFVIASSVAAIGTATPDHPPKKLPMPANHPFVGGPWPYALSKAMVEDLVYFMSTLDEYKDIDFILVRVGNVVTDPPEVKHLDGFKDGEEQSWLEKPAKPETPSKPKVFPEGTLCSVAVTDLVGCLKAAAMSDFKAGARTVAAVAPRAYTQTPVPELMRAYYGDKADEIDMTHYDEPGHEFDPIYSLSEALEIGWAPELDLIEGYESLDQEAKESEENQNPDGKDE